MCSRSKTEIMCEFVVSLINQTTCFEGVPVVMKLSSNGGLPSEPFIAAKFRLFPTFNNCTFLIFKGWPNSYENFDT